MPAFPALSFSAVFTASGMAKLGQIIVGDLTMAGDNVVIMGSLASGLPEKDRRRVLMLGVGMALAFLITFAVIATQLLKVTGLVFAGGLLLLWVAYNLWKEMRPSRPVVLDDPGPLAPNPDEVHSVHYTSLRRLADDDTPRWVPLPDGGSLLQMWLAPDWRVHAPTGAMLWQFREVVLLGRQARVADFAQPDWTRN